MKLEHAVVHPVTFEGEDLRGAFPVAHAGPTLIAGEPCRVKVDGRWVACVFASMEFAAASTVRVRRAVASPTVR